ncbi:MAG: phosphoribosylformylglycinamidine synthase subunit PurS [Alphaproteobacteria bacterium]|nr:phosphoribosylformylglycinamidine synthase subunit PurS [Alphaproteobacteria bacterium]
MKARVLVMPRAGVLDPQGKAVAQALAGLGFEGVAAARQGKVIELELAEFDPAAAEAALAAMCERLLANPVIEDYTIEIA